jgi:hypothetical protein
MADTPSAQLRKENDDLRLLVIRLSRIVLRIIVEQTGLPTLHDSRVPLQLPVELSPSEIVTALRELALRSAALSRANPSGRTTQTLESLSVEFAVAAEDLEAMFTLPAADQDPLARRSNSN